MKLLIRNALIVTMNEQNDVIEKGSIVIDGNQLAYVGPVEWTPPGPFGQTIDGDRMIAVPGMVNSHCHSPANLVRGMMPKQAFRNLASLLSSVSQRHARRGLLR